VSDEASGNRDKDDDRQGDGRRRLTTEEWAQALGISTAPTPPTVEGYDEPCPLTARQVATRAIILQGVVAVASGVDPEPVIEWLRDSGIWSEVSPRERAFLLDPSTAGRKERIGFQWCMEAEWALLWVIGKVEALGLPIRQCDTRRLVDEIIPALGSDIEPFLATAVLRAPGVLLAEDGRVYDLWCRWHAARRIGDPLPEDLDEAVLYQRVYALEWLHGIEPWDNVTADA
jgi:uncharacterized protein DUF4272